MGTPFIYGKMAIGNEFTNREKEREHLQRNFKSGISTVLISPRRWGKSSLVNHVAENLKSKPDIRFCFIDLYNIRSEKEFYKLYFFKLLEITSSRLEEKINEAKKLFRKLVPTFSFSPDPNSEIKISLNWDEVENNPEEILSLPEKLFELKNIHIIVCIDEFQNISHFNEPLAFQKKLRSHWQKHQNTTYCLYGSKRHMMMDFFTKPSMPFYNFGDVIFLEKISMNHWVEFIPGRFKATGKEISEKLAKEIAERMECHPYFVQQYSQTCWYRTKTKCSKKNLDKALEELLDRMTILYQRETEQLSTMQLNFLEAMCQNVEMFGSAETLKKYDLRSTAHVAKIKTALEKKEIIDNMGEEPFFIDPLYRIWLSKRYFSNRK